MWSTIEDRAYQLVKSLFPNINIIISYENAQEVKTPYCVVNMISNDPKGQGYISGMSVDSDGQSSFTFIQDWIANVRFAFVGPDDLMPTEFHGGNMASKFVALLHSEPITITLDSLQLGVMRRGSPRRVGKLRETKWYSSYEVDVTFSYCTVDKQVFDGTIDTVSIDFVNPYPAIGYGQEYGVAYISIAGDFITGHI